MEHRHTCYIVSNIFDSIAFWKKLGFSVVSYQKEKWNYETIEVAKLAHGGTIMIELINGDWEPHISLTVEGVDENLELAGIEPIMSQNQQGHKVRFIEDPDGNWIELVECLD